MARQKRALSEVDMGIGEVTLCGAQITYTAEHSAEAPHRHGCDCFPMFSSDPLCHRCSCAECAAGLTAYHSEIERRRALARLSVSSA